jgi:hypothetical protein
MDAINAMSLSRTHARPQVLRAGIVAAEGVNAASPRGSHLSSRYIPPLNLTFRKAFI